MEHESSAAKFNVRRLLASFSPPETPDLEIFVSELERMLNGLNVEAMTDGVTKLIETRRSKTFPAIGEIRQHVLDQLPTPKGAHSTDMHAVYAVEDRRRGEAMRILRELPIETRRAILRDEAQVRVFDFVVENGRCPDRAEYLDLRRQGERINRLLAEASEPPDEASSTFRHITFKAAGAIRYRREQIAADMMKGE